MLRALRQRAGLTQVELADRLGLASHTYLSHLERGKKVPSPALLTRLAAFFDVPMTDLVRGMEEDGTARRHA
jgi:transcriptional regulator with XRE-family HTH domain